MKKFFLKLKTLLFKPPAPKKVPVWTGKCACCGEDVESFDTVFPEGTNVEHISCLLGLSEAGRRREEDRRQIDLYKRAVKELEEEKQK